MREPLEIGGYYRFTQGGSYIMVIHGKTVLNGKYIIEQITDNMERELPANGYTSVWEQYTIDTFKIEKVPAGTGMKLK